MSATFVDNCGKTSFSTVKTLESTLAANSQGPFSYSKLLRATQNLELGGWKEEEAQEAALPGSLCLLLLSELNNNSDSYDL